MKTAKRIISILLTVLMLVSSAPLSGFVGLELAPKAAALNETGTCGENVTWSFDASTGTLTISGSGKMEDYYEEAGSPFYWNQSIKIVKIYSGVTSIGAGAFIGCQNLKSVEIADSVTIIGWAAFDHCNSLTSVVIPRNVSSIGSYAFYCCSALTSVEIPDSVTMIGDYAFYGCSSLTHVYYSGTEAQWNVISCGSNNASLIDTTIHCVEIVETGSCGDNLTWTLYDTGLLIISGSGAMDDYYYWEDSPFFNNLDIKTLSIESGVTSVCNYAFYGCSNLTNAAISNSVTSIGELSFYECNSLTSFSVDADNQSYASDEAGCLFNKGKTELIQFPTGNARTAYTIPDCVTSIGDYAFYGCSGLINVVIPNNVTNIGEYAFSECGNLASVNIGNGLKSIENRAFYNCSSLQSLIIPAGVTTIGNYAFCRCSDLTNVVIPNSLTSIGDFVFLECNSLTGFTVDADNPSYASDEVGCLFNKEKTELIQYPAGNTSTAFTLPNSVTSIGYGAFSGSSNLLSVEIPNSVQYIDKYAFSDCINLVSVNIGNGVTNIGDSAFYNCSSLQSLIIPAAVTTIGNYSFFQCYNLQTVEIKGSPKIGARAFQSCRCLKSVDLGSATSIGMFAFTSCQSLQSLVVPSSITIIGESAFYYCKSLTSVVIPNSVTSIGAGAFDSCSRLSGFTVDVDNPFYTSDEIGCLLNKEKTELIQYPAGNTSTVFTIPDSVTNIGYGAFSDSMNLISIEIPGSVTSIGDRAFFECTRLTSVEIPDSVTSIGEGLFYYCYGLTSITIPNSVTNIGMRAFYLCNSLTDVYYFGTEAQWGAITIGSNNEDLTGADIHFNDPGTIDEEITWSFDAATKTLTFTGTGALGDYGADYFNNEDFDISMLPPWYAEAEQAEIIVIGEGITEVGNSNFINLENVKNVLLPQTLQRIGDYAFALDLALKSIQIPETVTEIGKGAFSASGLKSVTVPGGVESLDRTFQHCWNLDCVVLSEGIKRTSHALHGTCLKTITIPASMVEMNEQYSEYNVNVIYNYSKTAVLCSESYVMGVCARGFTDPSLKDVRRLHSLWYAIQCDFRKMKDAFLRREYEDKYGDYPPETDGYLSWDDYRENYWGYEFDESFSEKAYAYLNNAYGTNYSYEEYGNIDNPAECISFGDWREYSEGTVFYCYNDSAQHERANYLQTNGEENYFEDDVYEDEGIHFLILNDGSFSETSCGHGEDAHRYQWVVDQEPSNGVDGYMHLECVDCGAVENENTPIPATDCAHVFDLETVSEETEASAATCTEPAYYYYSCSLCGLADRDAAHVFSIGEPLGHSFTSTTYESNNDGTHKTKCIRCDVYGSDVEGVQTEGASEECMIGNWSTVTPATCESDGLKRRTCVKCGYAEEEALPALGHCFTSTTYESNNDGTHKIQCTRCEKYGAVIDGVQTEGASETCSFSDWATVTPATCEADGLKWRTCVKCGYAEEEALPALGHSFTSTTYESNNDGTHKIQCIRCEKYGAVIDGVQTEGASVTCSMGNWNTVTSATCEADGLKRRTCVKCGYAEEEGIPALGHSFTSTTYESNNDGTHMTKCTRCDAYGSVLDGVQTEGASVTCSMGNWNTVTSATCEADGLKRRTCVKCGYAEEEGIPALGHSFTSTTYESNNDGTHKIKCIRCEKYGAVTNGVQTVGASVTCSMGNWNTATAATCEADGLKQRVCVKCGFIETDVIQKLGHDWNTPVYNWSTDLRSVTAETTCKHDPAHKVTETVEPTAIETTAPTCVKDGVRTYTAVFENDLFSNQTQEETIEKLGHDYQEEHFDPVGEEDGYTRYTCTRCTDTYTVLDPAAAVENLSAFAGSYQITLSWEISKEASVTGYQVYRMAPGETEFSLLAAINDRKELSYVDEGLREGETYVYRVRAMKGEVLGAESETVSAEPTADVTAPNIGSASPEAGYLSGNATVKVPVDDDFAIQSVTATLISQINDAETVVFEQILDPAPLKETIKITFDSSAVADGIYTLRVNVKDACGNETNKAFGQYAVNNERPSKVENLEVIPGATQATLKWDDVPDDDRVSFNVYLKNGEEWSLIKRDVKEVEASTHKVWTSLNNLQPETTYNIAVAAVDVCKNIGEYSEVYTFRTKSDTTAPIITSISPSPQAVKNALTINITAVDPDGTLDKMILQASSDKETWTDVEEKTIDNAVSQATVSFTMSFAAYDDGSVFVRGVAVDSVGNQSNTSETAPFVEYVVDTTAPAAPENVRAASGDGYVEISWDDSTEADKNGYYVYRAEHEIGSFVQIASGLKRTNYYDYTVQIGKTYYYKVTLDDTLGNMSESSAIVSGKANDDNAAPVVSITGDLDGVVGGSYTRLYVAATDRKIDTVVVEYQLPSETVYHTLLTQSGINASSFKKEVALPLDLLETGDTISIRAYAVDAQGNRSEDVCKAWSVDTTSPVIADYSVSLSESIVTVNWNGANESDLGGYRLYCNNEMISMQGAGKLSYAFTHRLENRQTGDYEYKLIAFDRIGNTAEQAQTVAYVNESQTEEPVPGDDGETVIVRVVAEFNCEWNMITDVQEIFDASPSTATGTRIVAYKWDFGDGTTSTQMRPKKTFHAAGEYNVNLTVFAESGHFARTSKIIQVEDPSNLSEVSVQVFDTHGNVLRGVPVTFDAFSDNPVEIYVGNDFKASMYMTLGTHYIGIQIKNLYPVYKKVDVVRGSGISVRLDLTDEQMVTAKFTVDRLTLDEVKDLLGDRIYDEEYQQILMATGQVWYTDEKPEDEEEEPEPEPIPVPKHVHTFDEGTIIKEAVSCAEPGLIMYACTGIKANGKKCNYTVYKDIVIPHVYTPWKTTRKATCEHAGKMIRSCVNCKEVFKEEIEKLPHEFSAWVVTEKPSFFNFYVGTKKRTCKNCGYVDIRFFRNVEHPIPPVPIPDDITGDSDSHIVMRTRVPVKASFLAEFFEVSVELDFNGTSEFALNDCAVTLNLPEGLSLYEGTPATQWIGTMQGGTGKSVVKTWYVYGKEAGTYSYSADFTGVLNMTRRRCDIHFESDEPITVYGRQAATIVYQFDEELHNGDFYFAIGLEASSEIPLYLPDIELRPKDDKLNFPMQQRRIKAECQSVLIQHIDGTEEYIDPEEYEEQPIEILELGATLFKIYKVKDVIEEDEVGYFKKAVVTSKNYSDVQVRIETKCLLEPLVSNTAYTFGIDNDVTNENITFKTGTVQVDFERNWFDSSKPNTVYNHDLAKFCAAYAMLGYAETDGEIKSYLEKCGFERLDSDMDTSRDEVNTFVAAKTITIGEERKHLIFVGTIGSNGDQWYSDFDPFARDRIKDYAGYDEFGQTHLSFADAREYAYKMLKKAMDNHYLSKHPENNILLFIGHSRGAAAANLLAAKAINEHIWADQSRIYAYTFATPNSTNKPEVGDARFSSIFNIVNPEDFVPKVMLRFWGYNRYGQTLVLPSKTNTSDGALYNRWLKEVRNKYSQFKTSGLTSTYYTPYPDGEKTTHDIIHSMYSNVGFVNELYFGKKYPYRYLAKQVGLNHNVVQIDEEASPYRFFKETVLKILVNKGFSSSISSFYEFAEGAANACLVLNNPRADFYKKLIMYFLNLDVRVTIDAESFWDWVQVVTQGLLSGKIKLSLSVNFECAHTMETYCAYMYTLSEEELTRPKGGYWGTINCPVDIEIINKASDEVVGRIIDNTVDEEIAAKENAVVMTVESDEKSFWLPSDGDYEVRFIGNDTGTMDYTLKEIDSDPGELKRTNLFDVALTDGKTYTSEIVGEAFELETYSLHCDDGTTVQPTEVIENSTEQTYSVTVSAEENGQAFGGGVYLNGDYATLTAYPDEGFDFAGWYFNDTVVSGDTEYRVRVDGDKEFTARFTSHQHTYTSSVTTPSTCTEPGLETFACSCGDSYTETIAPLGHEWGNWTVNGDKHTRSCKREGCNETQTQPHEWNEGEITKKATCKEEGVTTYTCTLCGAKYTDSLMITNHVDGDNDGACDFCGMRMSGGDACKYCGEVHTGFGGFFKKIAHAIAYAIGSIFGKENNHKHKYKSEVKEATCTEGGCTLYTCTVCGKTREENKTDALGHDWGEWVTDKEATCKEEGHRYRVCKRCEEKGEETVPPAHVDQDKDGKCDKCGAAFNKDNGEVCVYCGEVHKGFFKGIVYAFHKLLYKIGGKKKQAG